MECSRPDFTAIRACAESACTPSGRTAPAYGVLLAAVLALLATAGRPVAAQTLQGRVLDDQDDRPVPTALVRILDEDGVLQGVTGADSTGFYRIAVPEPGVYRLQAERLGYDGFETPLLEAQNPDGVYSLDLLMRRSPIPIPGLEVTTDVTSEMAARRVRQMIGLNPRSLRWEPVGYDELQDHAERAHDVTALMRWGNRAGIVVRETTEGPCYAVRGRQCLPVYLNGFRLNPEFVDVVPLDMLHTVVVLSPGESAAYGGGAVLLYTESWLR